MVRWTVLRPVLPDPDAEGGCHDGANHDRRRAGDRHAVLHLLRVAVGQDRPQADHAAGLPAGGDHLCADIADQYLQGDHALCQPGAREGACYVAGDGDRRPGGVLVPVQDDGHGEVHDLLRRGQGGAGGSLGELRQRARAEGHASSGAASATSPSPPHSPTSPRRSLPPSPSTAIRQRPIRRASTTR